MHKYRILIVTLMVLLLTSVCAGAWSQVLTYTNSELDEILAPIALYPDPLIAQVLPACTFPDQLIAANELVRQHGSRDIDRQDWDVSVKAVAYYPSLLQRLCYKPDWTISIGQAYIDEPSHVMWSIQRLRLKARRLGYLSTNRYQRVYDDSGYYRIVPVQAQYIYVPEYDPQIVYVQRRSSTTSNLISFGLGLLIGSWLNRDVDWHHNRVYYHGWNDSGWVNNSRRFVRTNNSYYVNNDFRNRSIEVDRNVRTRDIRTFRTVIRQNAGTFRLPVSSQSGRSNRGGTISRPSGRTNAPSYVTPSRPNRNNGRSNGNPNRGGAVRGNPNGRMNTPSFVAPSRPSRDNGRSNANPNRGGAVRGNPNGRMNTPSFTAPSRPSRNNGRSNGNSNRGGAVRGNPNGRMKAPSVMAPSRPSRDNGRSNPKPDRSAAKSRGAGGSDHGSARSNSKSDSKDHGQSRGH